MTQIQITAGTVTMSATLNDSPTAQAIVNALPIQASANCWGDEIYFGIPVSASVEPDAQEIVEVGGLAYWPPGNAFCIFFGRTPASTDVSITH
ncbi:MAG: cyclophilin-like fold protein [Chloroflexota bacterium]